jgi:DUF177 domain-containing protein
MSGFIINLAALPQGTSPLEMRAPARELDLPEAQWPGEIHSQAQVERTAERISIRGRVEATARLECVRCLGEFDRPIEAELTVYADRTGKSRGLERELERDDYMRFHDGRELDLRQDAREALLLEVPITSHCREECRGLCPRCGADLNQGPCGCPAGARGELRTQGG